MKMFKFLVDNKDIFIIAENELLARIKGKILPESEPVESYTLNESW